MELSSADISHFADNSWAKVEQLIDPITLDELRRAYEELEVTWSKQLDVTVATHRETISQITNLHRQHPSFAAQIHYPPCVAVAQQLLGCDRLQLFHDHAIVKHPQHSDRVPWHQDFAFWPLNAPRALSCWIALDDASPENGALVFIQGGHKKGLSPPEDFLQDEPDWGDAPQQIVGVKAGDVIFHSCLSWHCSPPNTGNTPRRAFIAIYMDANCRYDNARAPWHPTMNEITVSPGEPLNSDKFPLIQPAGR